MTKKLKPNTFIQSAGDLVTSRERTRAGFVAMAIENSMASEIFKQLQSGMLNNAANLTNDEQLTAICDWIVNL